MLTLVPFPCFNPQHPTEERALESLNYMLFQLVCKFLIIFLLNFSRGIKQSYSILHAKHNNGYIRSQGLCSIN